MSASPVATGDKELQDVSQEDGAMRQHGAIPDAALVHESIS